MGCLIDEIDAWKILIQMTRGLKSLHDLKILHRDLKSANIFLFSDGTAKIGDLNVSKVARRGLGYTQTGTPYYASPEVWDEKPYDNKSDIWSLGCVAYEMLTLHPPFRAKDMDQLYKAVTKGIYKKIGDKYSSDMNEIIDYLLRVYPGERPNCDQILKHPLVKKRLEFFQAQSGENEDLDNIDEGVLLRTIRIPKNIIFLSENLPEKNYEKSKSHSKAMGMNIHKKNSIQNPNSSLPNIKILNNLKGPNLKNIEINNKESSTNNNSNKGNNINSLNDNLKEQKENNNNLNLNKILRKGNSNISVSKNNIYNLEIAGKFEKNLMNKEKSNLSKSPPIQQNINKYENNVLKKNINHLDLLQMERRKLYGKNNINNINNKKQKLDDIYNHYAPLYGNNKYIINKYCNNKINIEGNKHESLLPNIFNNKSMVGNNSNGNSKIITNRRLKPIIAKKNIIKINP
jgi:NIMA (never in mitosis gene a)-related kinase